MVMKKKKFKYFPLYLYGSDVYDIYVLAQSHFEPLHLHLKTTGEGFLGMLHTKFQRPESSCSTKESF